MKFAILLVLIFNGYLLYSQTCIIIIKTDSSIIIAADTRVRNFKLLKIGTAEEVITENETYRKIGGGGKVFFAISGQPLQPMFEIADSVCKSSENIVEAIKAFYPIAANRMAEIIDDISSKSKKFLEDNYLNKETCSLLFCSIQDGSPVVIDVHLRVNAKPNGFEVVPVFTFYPDENGADFEHFAVGHRDAIADSIVSAKVWQNKDPIQTSIRLIKIQAMATPETVSAPIDVLFLDKNKGTIKRYD